MLADAQKSFGFAPKMEFKTEGVKYAGSKAKLLKHIVPEIAALGQASVLDGFAGTTRVSQALAQAGMNVTINDRALLSQTVGTCYLLGDPFDKTYDDQIRHLNSLTGQHGWFSEHYGGRPNAGDATGHDGTRKPWQLHNTRKLDSIRPEIDKIAQNEINKAVLLTSLISALDSVDNTLGHYAAYLSKWSARSFNNLTLRRPAIIGQQSNQLHHIHSSDIFEILDKAEYGVCYFDPPYGSNNEKMPPSRVRYGAYYHVWKTIILNDEPTLFGKVNRREDSRDSVDYSPFEDFRRSDNGRFKSVEAIDRLIRKARCEYVVLSYSSGGRATMQDLLDVLSSNGKVEKVTKLDHARHVMASMVWTGQWVKDFEEVHQEYIFILRK